jgi:aspartyl-tRNA(Asn)/glutamyl-tRNA(Gln) amidotransferase subunit A
MTSVSTRQLFQSATDMVRTWPLDPPDRPPAFSLPRPEPPLIKRPRGPVEGLPGDLCDTRTRIESGDLDPGEPLDKALERIEAFGAALGAFEHAAAFTRGQPDLAGPLGGIPISVKDIIDVAGMPTTGSSVALAPRVAERDATAVARLRAAGAAIVGKAATHEFALGVTTPQAHSPWDPRLIAGGSSGGSAISLVTGMALGSLGTDTRASIRVPAALCGLVGFKPSLGVVPTDNWLTLSWTLDHFAPMARSVRDIAVLMDVLTASPGLFRGVLPATLEGRRIGYSEATVAGAQPEVEARFRESLAAMEAAGASVRCVDAPTAEDFALANATGLIVSRAEAAHFHEEAGTDFEKCIPEVRDQLQEARMLHATDYVRALRLRGQLRDRLAAAFAGIDILAMPTCKVVAPPREDADDYLLVLSENCIPWSLVDFPALSLYMGQATGLPAGIQLVAAPGQDLLLIAAAYGFERVAPVPPTWAPS